MPKIALEINFYLLLRVSELVNTRIQDLDFEKHLLHVPKTKTISEEDGGFYVPLSEHVEQLFKHALSKRTAPATNVYVFESKTDSGHASERTIIDLFYQSNLPMTIHGIRAMGRTWLGLKGVKFEFAEACLSHKVGNQTVQAYLRTDFIEERRVHMAEWSDFVQECIGSNSVISAT
jgi:integrase